jgi:hypothetical protein
MEHLLAMQEKTVSHDEVIMADMMAWRKEMKADREATEAYPEKTEANPEEAVVHEEVPKEEAAMKTVGAQKERCGNRHLAVGHC